MLIIEDDALIRASLTTSLNALGIGVVGSGQSAKEALAIQGKHKPDVALLDLDLGIGPNGIDLANVLRKNNPQIGLVILTSYSSPKFAPNHHQMPIGARFLPKSTVSDMQQVVSVILQAKKYPTTHGGNQKKEKSDLTEAQITLLKYISDGLTTQEISHLLGISTKGVEANLARIQDALDIHKSSDKNVRVSLSRAYLKMIGKI